MRNIVNIDLTNTSCCGSFNSACDCNELLLNVTPLSTQLTNYRIEVTDVSGTIHTSDVINLNETYEVNSAWFNGSGTMKVRLLSNEGNSSYFNFTCISFTNTDDITCKYSSNNFVFSKCSNTPTNIPIASATRLGGIKVGNNLSITSDGVLSSVGTQGEKGDKGDKGDRGDDGAAATINVGEVITGAPNTPVQVSNSGTENAAIFNFSIPKGEKGDSGSSTGTQKAFYITNNHKVIDDESSVEGYDEITIYKKNDTPAPITYTYTFTEGEKVSPSALYQVWLYLGNLSTLRTYTVIGAIKVNGVLISDGEFTFRPTTSTELVCIPMNVNYLESELDVNVGDIATYDISIKNDLLVQYTGYLYYGGTKSSMVVRNGGSMSATDVYDMFEGETSSQSEINSALKERVNNKVDKEEGKCLSTNDYTTADKAKLDDISPASIAYDLVQAGYFYPKDVTATLDDLSLKQDKLTAGENVSISNTNIISATDTVYNDSEVRGLISGKVDKVSGKGLSTNDYTTTEKNKLSTLSNYDDTEVRGLISTKQDELTAGTNITIDNNVISAAGGSGGSYTAGENININGNVISATDTKYTAGTNVTIDSNNVISVSGGITYSNTVEVFTNNYWIDGKKIYCKTFNGISATSVTDLSSLKIETYIKCEGAGTLLGQYRFLLPYYGDNTKYLVPLYNTSNKKFSFDNKNSWTAICATIYYTKTTN